jgi:predicted transcriptional regulator
MPYARVAITLPKDLLAATDRRAREHDRSRSGVIVEALRAFLTERVAAPAEPAYGAGPVARARKDQLERDLARTPAERLHRAEEGARLARATRRVPRRARQQIIGFDSYEDFAEWKNRNRA